MVIPWPAKYSAARGRRRRRSGLSRWAGFGVGQLGVSRRPSSARSRSRSWPASRVGPACLPAMDLEALVVEDLGDLLDVNMDELARPVALVTHRRRLRCSDHLSGQRVALTQVGDAVAAQNPAHRPGRNPELGQASPAPDTVRVARPRSLPRLRPPSGGTVVAYRPRRVIATSTTRPECHQPPGRVDLVSRVVSS